MMEVGDIICERCHGSGEGTCLSGGGPDAYDVPCECPGCGGTGVLKTWDEQLTDAYAEGRKDEREGLLKAIRAAGFDLREAPNGHQFLLNVQAEAAIACEIRCEG